MRVVPRLDDLPPVIVVMPDAPWSDRGSWYVDSSFTGTPTGRPVRTALSEDLVAHVDATYRTLADREHRVVGGCSMGGAGALELLLARPDLFSGALALSPAVYEPLPPADSTTRAFGAFGSGPERFVDAVYAEHTAAALLAARDPAHPRGGCTWPPVIGTTSTTRPRWCTTTPSRRPASPRGCACCPAGTTGPCGRRRSWTGCRTFSA